MTGNTRKQRIILWLSIAVLCLLAAGNFLFPFGLFSKPAVPNCGPEHRRWALVRSVSKFAGPDMCLAVTATDPDTAARLEMRLRPGTTWVSHLLQRVTHSVMTDPTALALIDKAATHYAERNAAVADLLTQQGLPVEPGDGMSLWIELPTAAREVAERLTRRGWLVRTGDEFRLEQTDEPSHHLRLTVHDLDEDDIRSLVNDLAEAAGTAT